jgi:hypothetical protein
VLAAVAAGGCRGDTLAEGVTDSTFVAIMADLERIERTPGLDSSARVAARTATLQRRGLKPVHLEAAARALADDPARALAIYRAIDARASGDTLSRADSGKGSPAVRRR